MFSGISQFCQNYYDQIPPHTLKTIGCGAVLSFTASVCVQSNQNQTVNSSRAALATTIAVVATLINTITTPIFNYIFDTNNNTFNGYKGFFRYSFDIILTQILINHSTDFKINLLNPPNLQHDNFSIFPHTLIKMGMDMVVRAVNVIDSNTAADLRNIFTDYGVDFNTNSSPVYITV